MDQDCRCQYIGGEELLKMSIADNSQTPWLMKEALLSTIISKHLSCMTLFLESIYYPTLALEGCIDYHFVDGIVAILNHHIINDVNLFRLNQRLIQDNIPHDILRCFCDHDYIDRQDSILINWNLSCTYPILNYRFYRQNKLWYHLMTDTLLSEAAKQGNVDKVTFILAYAPSECTVSYAIEQAACWGHIEVLHILFAYGEYTDIDHLLFLCLDYIPDKLIGRFEQINTSVNQFVLTAKLLISMGADVNARHPYSSTDAMIQMGYVISSVTPIYLALKSACYEMVRILLAQGTTFHSDDVDEPILLVAIYYSCPYHLIELLLRYHAPITENITNKLMQLCADRDLVTVAKLLVRHNATIEPDYQPSKSDIFTVALNKPDFMTFLMETFPPDNDLVKALLLRALASGYVETVRLLLDTGHVLDNYLTKELCLVSKSAMMLLLRDRNMVQLLIDRNVDIHVEADTPLLVAILENNYDVALLLLNHGADINIFAAADIMDRATDYYAIPCKRTSTPIKTTNTVRTLMDHCIDNMDRATDYDAIPYERTLTPIKTTNTVHILMDHGIDNPALFELIGKYICCDCD